MNKNRSITLLVHEALEHICDISFGLCEGDHDLFIEELISELEKELADE